MNYGIPINKPTLTKTYNLALDAIQIPIDAGESVMDTYLEHMVDMLSTALGLGGYY